MYPVNLTGSRENNDSLYLVLNALNISKKNFGQKHFESGKSLGSKNICWSNKCLTSNSQQASSSLLVQKLKIWTRRTVCLKYERVPYVFLHLLNTILINEMYSEVFHRLVNPRGLSGKACRVLRGLSIITLI